MVGVERSDGVLFGAWPGEKPAKINAEKSSRSRTRDPDEIPDNRRDPEISNGRYA